MAAVLAVCAVRRAGCCVRGGVPCGGKHVILEEYVLLLLGGWRGVSALLASLYTILLCTILYGVGHNNGGSGGVRISRNSIAIVLQPCGQCRGGRGNMEG